MDIMDRPVTYLLLLHLATTTHLRIGSLGEFDFPGGYYAYVGSARKNAYSRLRRHLEGNALKKRWHIDYLRPHCSVMRVELFDADTMAECQLAAQITRATIPVKRFGSSDCRCPAHLFYFGQKCPSLRFSVQPCQIIEPVWQG